MDETVKDNVETVKLPSETLIYKEVTVSISMSKSLCLEVPENYTKEEIIEQAKKVITTPNKLLQIANQVFQQFRIGVEGADFNGWEVDELEYITNE